MTSRNIRGFALLALVASLLSGCEVTREKIDIWKQSDRGAAKIRAAVRDTGQTMAVRTYAAEALAEMGLAMPLADDLKAISAADRGQITAAVAKDLVVKMKGPNPKSTTRVQIQAKDALFSIRDLLDPAERAKVDREVVAWILGDVRERDAGEHSTEKIVNTIGAPAGGVLVDALDQQGAPLNVIAMLLRKVGSEADRDKGALKLVALAKKQDPIPNSTFFALGKVGSLNSLRYLEELAKGDNFERRVLAVRAMGLFPRTEMLPTLEALAADESLKDKEAMLRDDAFASMEQIKDPKTKEILVKFLQDKDEKVRYRAVEAMASGFGADGVQQLLDALPTSYTYKKVDLIDFVEQPLMQLGKSVLPPLRKALTSESWIARVVAAHVLGEVGTREDLPALQKLVGDTTKIKGWTGGATVGSEAQAAVDSLKKRSN